MIKITDIREIPIEKIIALYQLNKWSAAHKPQKLYQALMQSHALFTAWQNDQLVGLGNAISDGHLVVYFPHLLVHPDFQKRGIGRMIMQEMLKKYQDFHMQILTSDNNTVDFYKKMGFEKAGSTQPMWIYKGDEH